MTNSFTEYMQSYLRPGEQLASAAAYNGFDIKHIVYSVRDEAGNEGNTVLIEMERYGRAVEAVTLTSDVTLSVRAVSGTGLLVMHDGETDEVSAVVLDAGEDMDDTEPYVLKQGDSYAYINVGQQSFIIRDDCTPAFKPEYEEPATNPELLATLGQLGVFEYAQPQS